MAYFHSTPYCPYSPNTTVTAPSESMSTMRIPIFDATEDAYWWVLCTEKYFKQWKIPETQKMKVAAITMQGSALTWWLQWYPRHPSMNWDAFTAVFLWNFKPEWRVILPLPDDETEYVHESSLLATDNAKVAADSTLIANDLNNSALDDTQREGKNHGDDGFEDQSHLNILVDPRSEGVGEIATLPTTATTTILIERFSDPTREVINNNAVRNQGLSMKSIFSVSLDFVSQARTRNSTFKMNLNPFLDERKVLPMSVYGKLDVDITGIQHDSRFVPPANCNVENSGTHDITTTNCLTKCMNRILHFKVDLCYFNGKCITHNITTKGPHCEFITLATNTLSSAMSRTKLLGGGLLSMGCTMALPREEFARQFCSHIHLMKTSPLRFKEEIIMYFVSFQWFYSPHVPATLLERLILKLDFRPPAKPPDPYRCIEDDEFMVLHNQLLMLVFTIEAWLQASEVICNELKQVLFLKQLGCTQLNNVKSWSSTKYITVQVIQLADIAVLDTFITLPFLLKFTCDMNLHYKEGLLNPILTYDVGSYWFVQNILTHAFSWCGFVTMVYKPSAISKTCELKWLLIEIERNNFSSVLTNSACSKLMEVLVVDSKYIGRYITVGLVAPYFLVKNTSINMAAACGGVNNIGVFHNELGMPIKPYVTLGRSTWTAPNHVCNVMFKSIVVDHIECETTALFNCVITSKSVLIFMDLEDKIIFRGVGNDMIYAVWVSCMVTNMFYNEKTISNNKDIEVEKLGNTRHTTINKLWCCYHSDKRFLVYDFISNGSLMGIMNGKKSLLYCHYNYIPPIVINTAEGLAYSHHNYVLPIGHKQMRFIKVLSEVFKGKVAGIGASKVVPFVCKVVLFMYVTLVRRRERKKWDPGRHLVISTTVWSFKFKQWDPGKICVASKFYNLEDKVDFEGVSNVMILEAEIMSNPKVKGSGDSLTF